MILSPTVSPALHLSSHQSTEHLLTTVIPTAVLILSTYNYITNCIYYVQLYCRTVAQSCHMSHELALNLFQMATNLSRRCRRAALRALGQTRAMSNRASVGYKGFGSFHSDNVEELVDAACNEDWRAPPLPQVVSTAQANANDVGKLRFGKSMREHEFLLGHDWTFINHGAFGSPCRTVFEAAAAWRLHAELQPLQFIDRELFPHLVSSLRTLGDIVKASPRSLVFLINSVHKVGMKL